MKRRHLGVVVSLFAFTTVGLASSNPEHTYLALGDSVAFGLNEALLPPFTSLPPYPTPSEFIGYPEAFAQLTRFAEPRIEINASCPGETSASFLTIPVPGVTPPDNGCNSSHVQPGVQTVPPFKTVIGLHTSYTVAQMDFAESQFNSNKQIDLVTLSIGANDILLVLPQLEACGTDPVCGQNVLTPVLQAYAVNLAQILTRIRAHYRGALVLLTYYAPAPSLNTVAQALNGVMTQVAAQFPSIKIADGYDAFRLASAPFNGDACQAGLLIRFPPNPVSPCDIHPSVIGRYLLAATVAASLLPVL